MTVEKVNLVYNAEDSVSWCHCPFCDTVLSIPDANAGNRFSGTTMVQSTSCVHFRQMENLTTAVFVEGA